MNSGDLDSTSPDPSLAGITATAEQFEDIGSLYGVIELIGSNPRSYFILRERTTGQPIPVYFTDVHQPLVLEGYRRRVEVTGRVRYEARGMPISVDDIASLDLLPDRDDLPPPETFIGTLPDLTGGLTLDEYLDRIRGRDVER
jgi:hypothetical protein